MLIKLTQKLVPAVFAIIFSANALPASTNFLYPGELFQVGNKPVGVIVADVNGDGKPDLVVVNSADNTVSVLLGNGDGTFKPQAVYSVGQGPVEVAVADVNGDGKPDIITANATAQTVSVLLGNGDGTFQPAVNIPVPVKPEFLSVADVNNDGKLDIVVAGDLPSGQGGEIAVLPGNGNGTFQAPITTMFPYNTVQGQGPLLSFNLADVNLDGKLDAVLQIDTQISQMPEIFQPVVYIAQGNGNGTFAPPVLPPSSLQGLTDVIQADVNNDGNQEILGQIGFQIQVLGNSPLKSAVYTGSPNSRQFNGNAGINLLTVDMDGTGKLDVLSSSGQIFFNDGGGNFQLSGGPYRMDDDLPSGTFITAGVFTDDGLGDVIYLLNNQLVIYPGNGDGSFQIATDSPEGPGGITNNVAVSVGDLNGDGRLDYVMAGSSYLSPSGALNAALQGWDDTFNLVPTTFVTGNHPVALVLADLTGNGKLDAITANSTDNTVSVLLGNGDGTFGTAVPFAVGSSPTDVVAADVNSDGKPDLVVTNSGNNTVSVLLGNGDGTFQSQTSYPVGSQPSAVTVADFNNDGKPDLAVANAGDGTVSVLLGNGNGTFQPQSTYTIGAKPSAIAAADLRNNGKVDLVVANTGTNNVSVLLGNGNGTFQPQVTYSVGFQPLAVAVRDVNGDGIPDIVTTNSDGTISVLLGNGDGTFQSVSNFLSAMGNGNIPPTSAFIADVNGDGIMDIVDNTTILYGFVQPPGAWDARYTTTGNTPVKGVLRASSPTGKPLTFIVGNPNQGTLISDASGAFTYTPPSFSYSGIAYFNFLVTDGTHYSRDATVYIDVTPSSGGGGGGGGGGGSGGGGSSGGGSSGGGSGGGSSSIFVLAALCFLAGLKLSRRVSF